MEKPPPFSFPCNCSQPCQGAKTRLLDCRSSYLIAVFGQATHEFFQGNGFHYVHTPLISASDCEGAGEMFQVTTLLGRLDKATGSGRVDVEGLKQEMSQQVRAASCVQVMHEFIHSIRCLNVIIVHGSRGACDRGNCTVHVASVWECVGTHWMSASIPGWTRKCSVYVHNSNRTHRQIIVL